MEYSNGQRVSHEQFGLGIVTYVYTNDFESQRRYDVVFDNIRGYKTVLGIYLTDAEPKTPTVVVTLEKFVDAVKSAVRDLDIPVLDLAAGQQAKEEGMKKAAESRPSLLSLARSAARTICVRRGEVYMDLVYVELLKIGVTPKDLGNAAGSVFRGAEWVFTGRLHTSTRKDRHAGAQRIWVNTSVTRQAVAA